MNKMTTAVACAAALIMLNGCNQQAGGLPRATDPPATSEQKQSYALGQNMGASLKATEIAIDSAYFNAGFYDALDDVQRMTQEDMQTAMGELQQAAQQKQQMKQAEVAQANLAAAETYLTENAAKEGVITTESGLQYKIISAGDGATPVQDDIVSVNYEGRLIDGTVFDSSYQRGQPAKFPVGGVIAGWTEALKIMPVGSKWELYVPPELAYGERGAGTLIQPNSTLIFDVELLTIEPKPEAAAE